MTAQGLKRTAATSSSTLLPYTSRTRATLRAHIRRTVITSCAERTGRPASPLSTRNLRRKHNVSPPRIVHFVCTILTSLSTIRGSPVKTFLVKLAPLTLCITFSMPGRSFGHWRSLRGPRINMTIIRSNTHSHAQRLVAQRL